MLDKCSSDLSLLTYDTALSMGDLYVTICSDHLIENIQRATNNASSIDAA